MPSTYTFDKEVVLQKLLENRDQHHTIFLEALEGYKQRAIEVFEEKLNLVKRGKVIDQYIRLIQPEDHTKDYNRIISILNMSLGDTIELTEQQFSQYVLDDWDWKQQFLSTNAAYSSTAQRLSSEE